MPRSTTLVWRAVACLFGLTGVMIGAVAAHALPDPHAAASVGRASLYQILHAIVLLIVASQPGRFASLARGAFALGITLFCGAIYLKFWADQSWASPLTPYGGTALMAGWLLAACAYFASLGNQTE